MLFLYKSCSTAGTTFLGNVTWTHHSSTNLISHNSLSDFDIDMLTTTSNDSFNSQQGQLLKFITTFKPQTPYSFFHNTKWSNTYHIWTNVPNKELILCKCVINLLPNQPNQSYGKLSSIFSLCFSMVVVIFWIVSMEISLRGFWLMFLCACVGIYVIRGGLGGGDELGVQASSFWFVIAVVCGLFIQTFLVFLRCFSESASIWEESLRVSWLGPQRSWLRGGRLGGAVSYIVVPFRISLILCFVFKFCGMSDSVLACCLQPFLPFF